MNYLNVDLIDDGFYIPIDYEGFSSLTNIGIVYKDGNVNYNYWGSNNYGDAFEFYEAVDYVYNDNNIVVDDIAFLMISQDRYNSITFLFKNEFDYILFQNTLTYNNVAINSTEFYDNEISSLYVGTEACYYGLGFEVSDYDIELTANSNEYFCYLDTGTLINNNSGGWYRDFNRSAFVVRLSGGQQFSIGYYNVERDTQAYYDGYNTGYQNGYDNGYNVGFKQGSISDEQANAFTYIGNAVGAVGQILEIEILPHISLGLVASIPIVFGILMAFIRMVKK